MCGGRYSRIGDAFKAIDAERSGKLDRDEVVLMLKHLNLTIPVKVVNAILDLADTDGDGEINYGEFAKMISDK